MQINIIAPFYLRTRAAVSSHKVILLKPADSLRKLSESMKWTKVQTCGTKPLVGFIPNSMTRVENPHKFEIRTNSLLHYDGIGAEETTKSAEKTSARSADDLLPKIQLLSAPPWMTIAENEFNKNIKENGNPPNPKILKYFRSTSWKRPKFEAPWCAAFVSYCMDNCSNDFIKLKNLSSARASDWANWGTALENPRFGALAVLRPLSKGMSGHVGFVSKFSELYVELLGGNQNNALTKRKFSLSKVLQFRWLDWWDAENVPESDLSIDKADPPESIFNEKYNATFRSLVPNGFFSSDPDDSSIQRSVRTNNPGALNVSDWQKSFSGFVGVTPGDRAGNRTSIYVTPEHGIAAWYKLITEIYGFASSTTFRLSELAKRYSGISKTNDSRVNSYLAGWEYWTNGHLKRSSLMDLGNPGDLQVLAKGMFAYEAGIPSPLLDDQISEGIELYVRGRLPSK